jgi:hypothetical protein
MSCLHWALTPKQDEETNGSAMLQSTHTVQVYAYCVYTDINILCTYSKEYQAISENWQMSFVVIINSARIDALIMFLGEKMYFEVLEIFTNLDKLRQSTESNVCEFVAKIKNNIELFLQSSFSELDL